ncbi:c-type cytochrome [Cochlodiniinecator piscidefendens]|uniref:c-type cytochrome n=1 Tax=Cochlodiniinecator piscidefendens TaxID=2715756 RepID=UPI00197B2E4D|nr:cytochrome C [Cochlodiniinecator piscidefendens]
MKHLAMSAALAAITAATPSFANGDPEAGEGLFRRCKSCHAIENGDDVIVRGGRTGPNLYGVIGRAAGTVDGFNYSDDLAAAGAAGLIWTEENLAEYATDPRAFLRTYLDDGSARTAMSFRLRNGGEDVAAYLASVGPVPVEMPAEDGETTVSE